MTGPDFHSGSRPYFFYIETLSITGEIFSKCLTNGSDRLRKGILRRRGKPAKLT